MMWSNQNFNWEQPTNGCDHWAVLAQQWAANRNAVNQPQINNYPHPPVNNSFPPPPPPPPPSNSSVEPDWTADVIPPPNDGGSTEEMWIQQPDPSAINKDINYPSNTGPWISEPPVHFNTPPPNFQRPPPIPRPQNFYPSYNQTPPPHVIQQSQRPRFPPRPDYSGTSYWPNNSASFSNQPHGDIDERVMPPPVSTSSPWTDTDVDYRPQMPFAHQIIEAAAKSYDMIAPPPVPTHLMEPLTGCESSDASAVSSSDSAAANKRKAIPAWLREALDKREKEKTKEAIASIAAEEAKLGVKRDDEGDVVMEDVKIDDDEKSESPKKGKFDEDSDSEEENVESEIEEDKTIVKRPTLNELLQNLEEDRKDEELAYSLTRVLTEVLLEVTNNEMLGVASRVFYREERKFRKVRKLADTNSKASTPNKLAPVLLGGLLDYGSGSDNDEALEDDAKSSITGKSANAPVSSSDSESGEELDALIREKKRRFIKQAALRERKTLPVPDSSDSNQSENEEVEHATAPEPPRSERNIEADKSHLRSSTSSSDPNKLRQSDNKRPGNHRRSRSRSQSNRRNSRRSGSSSSDKHHRRNSHSRSRSSTPRHAKKQKSHHRHRSSSNSSVKKKLSRSRSRSPHYRKTSDSSRKHRPKKMKDNKSHRRRKSLSSSSDEPKRKHKSSNHKESDLKYYSDERKQKKKRHRKKSRSSSLSTSRDRSKKGVRKLKSRSKSSSEKSSRKKSSHKDKKSKKSRK